MKRQLTLLALFLLFVPQRDLQAADGPKTVKVFILAGQSNMEGKAPNALLDHQATDGKTKDLFAHLPSPLQGGNFPGTNYIKAVVFYREAMGCLLGFAAGVSL